MSGPRKVQYVDMDNVLVDFPTAFARVPADVFAKYQQEDRLDEIPGIFALMDPVADSINSYNDLAEIFDTYILSTSPWENPTAWSDKLQWVKRHLGRSAYKRMILSHHKNLNAGHFLIDDRTKNGVELFAGEHIHFKTPTFPDWPTVVRYLRDRAT